MAPRFWSPLHLSGVTGALNSIGSDLQVNPQKLLNPNRGPMLIDQFRFSFDQSERATYENEDPTTAFLSIIAAEIRLGAIPFMSSPVTLGAFVPRYVGSSQGGQPLSTVSSSFSAVPNEDTIWVWHLAKPIFVPQNVQVGVRFIRQRLFAIGSTGMFEPTLTIPSVRVSIAGRSLPEDEPSPQKIWVPWVSETKASVEEPTFTSADSDLINAHAEPLHVKALGAVNYVATDAIEPQAGRPSYGDLRVQMTSSNGTAIIRDPTPYTLVFPNDRGTLPVDAVLQPGQFLRCGLEVVNSPSTAVDADKNVQFTSVGMTGYRLIDTPRANR